MNKWKQVKAGNSQVISELYMVIFPKVYSWILKNSGNKQSAEDIFQEVLINIVTDSSKDRSVENIEAFIFTMCKYKWIDSLRKNKNKSKVISDEVFRLEVNESFEMDFIELEEDRIKYIISTDSFLKLSDLCRKLLDFVKKGMSSSEIVQKMNMNSNNTYYRRKFACMEAWKKYSEQHKLYHLINKK